MSATITERALFARVARRLRRDEGWHLRRCRRDSGWKYINFGRYYCLDIYRNIRDPRFNTSEELLEWAIENNVVSPDTIFA
jgi:hypothetical protein